MVVFSILWLSLILLLPHESCAGARRYRFNGNEASRTIKVLNESGVRVDVFWIHPTTNHLADSNTNGEGITYGSMTHLDSYVSHQFEVQELPNTQTGQCRHQEGCRKGYFTVTENEDQVFTVQKNFTVFVEDHRSRAMDKASRILQGCRELLDASLTPNEQVDALADCMEEKIQNAVKEHDDDIDYQSTLRLEMGEKMVPYVCQNANGDGMVKTETTRPLYNQTWTYLDEKRKRNNHEIKMLFESEYSSVQLVEDFLSPEQCQALVDGGVSAIDDKAAVADDSKLVQQKTIPISVPMGNAHAKSATRKIEYFASHVWHVNLDYSERDPVMNVRVVKSSPTKQQPNAADTDEGSSILNVNTNHESTLANLMVVCEAPKSGGAIHFPKTGTHLQTKNLFGAAVFILHGDPITRLRETEPFINEYIVCPVKEGTLSTLIDNYSD